VKEFEERGLLHCRPIALSGSRTGAHAQLPRQGSGDYGRPLHRDSNHHRIVAAGFNGAIRRIYGSGVPGFTDGPADGAAFQQPQEWRDPARPCTSPIQKTRDPLHRPRVRHRGHRGGTGEQALLAGTGGPGLSTPLSSPWDLALMDRVLYIAMAGTHQIWTLDLDRGTVAPFAGTGREGSARRSKAEAWFAQSSGLAILDGHL